MIAIEGSRTSLYQWDLNQRIVLVNIDAGIQVHFSHNSIAEENCPVVISYEENGSIYANIPNIYLQTNGIITVYIYVKGEDEAHTEHHAEILVLPRPKPSDYVYTETEVLTWERLERQIEEWEEENAISIDVSEIEDGHRVIVGNEKNGNKTFDVMNGKKGDKGDKGDVNFATFNVDVSTGCLFMHHNDSYNGPSFNINESGELEVNINGTN